MSDILTESKDSKPSGNISYANRLKCAGQLTKQRPRLKLLTPRGVNEQPIKETEDFELL